jgi:phospholipid/cholesterol/gamma-HCH transport system substrate-binding protein
MLQQRAIDLIVGIFVIFAFCAAFFLVVKASSFTDSITGDSYSLNAKFDEIGSLMVKSPVRIAGVKIGEVTKISLDKKLFKAVVSIEINNKDNSIPKDSSVSIMTDGLLGAKYLSIAPGFDIDPLKNGDEIKNTHSAIILENMLGKLLFS